MKEALGKKAVGGEGKWGTGDGGQEEKKSREVEKVENQKK